MVVNGFEWIVLGLILFGMVIPFWLMTYLTAKISRTSRDAGPHRIMRYNEVMDYLHSGLKRSKIDGLSGASLVATIRELENYPEHRDVTLLYLEEITITGSGKFDELAKSEIQKLETYLLGLKDD
ncbi:hypothetical protein [Qipengyuania huizhouensis]|uniref:hypothetical protein n=1 Tax=Qipengyuania huizhouensis TaxID=2867245 RepID=UPI001C88C40E|nr:hypothetical protein [Qipengyuania huizhouensis]